jgi:hypothetical protein
MQIYMRVYAQLHTYNTVFKKVLPYPKKKGVHALKKAGPVQKIADSCIIARGLAFREALNKLC